VTDHSDTESHEPRIKSVEDSISTIERLEELRDRGSITEEEFILMKKRALDS
jgi:photosynthetic reaction center H subunit